MDRLAAHDGQAPQRAQLTRQLRRIDTVIDEHALRAIAEPAPYLTNLLGPRPADRDKARLWDRTGLTVERYRHGTLGLIPAAGPIEPGGTPLHAAIGRPSQGSPTAHASVAIAVESQLRFQAPARQRGIGLSR